MKSFSEKLFNIPLGGKTRFSRNSSCSSRSWRTQKVTLPKVGNFCLKVTEFLSLRSVPLLGIPKNPEFIPKTCIIYPEMDQTVEKYQEHSRTRRTVITDSRNHEWKLRIKKQNRPFDQKCKGESEYAYYFRFRRLKSKNKEDAEALKTNSCGFLERKGWSSNDQTEGMFEQTDKGHFIYCQKSKLSPWDACNHEKLMSDMSD